MDPKIVKRYNDDILHEAMERFGIAKDKIKLLDGFESFIYEFSREGEDLILRVGHSLRRTPKLIHGEVDWINYLAAGGANVAKAVFSLGGKLIEAIDDGHGDQFMATAFVKAAGVPAWKIEWTPEFVEHYGRVIGRIHALTKDYAPANPAWRRPEWDAPGNLDIAGWVPKGEAKTLAHYNKLKAYLDTLPKDHAGYGLIHQDAHGGNFFVKDGAITLFDFDDCVYGWFIYDIAMVLFYAALEKADMAAFTKTFMSDFLRGYAQENSLDPRWLMETPHFLKLREIDLYAVIHRSFDVENLDDPWCARYMDGRKEKIEENVPFIELDWGTLGK